MRPMRRPGGPPGRILAAIACLLLLSTGFAETLTVKVAAFTVIAEEGDEAPSSLKPEKDLVKLLGATPIWGGVEFSLVGDAAAAPLTFLDAARLCELSGDPYLLYGYVRRRESVYSSELKLLSKESKRIVASFVATDGTAHYERMVGDLASKVANYFLSDLGMAPGKPAPAPSRNVFEIPIAAGYWSPTGSWAESLMGVFCVDLGLRFVPRKPLAGIKSRPLYLGFGLRSEYALGKNKPEYESAYLHRIVAKLPVELFVSMDRESTLGLSLGGIMEFDVFKQDRNYAGMFTQTSSAGGIMASVFYRYALSERAALGFDMEWDSVFYTEPLVTISPRLRFEYSFQKRREAEAE
jgi:hypothetical protein